MLLGKPVPLGDPNDMVHIPLVLKRVYARESKAFNPFHISTLFASYADLPGLITHGIHTNAVIRGLARSGALETKQKL